MAPIAGIIETAGVRDAMSEGLNVVTFPSGSRSPMASDVSDFTVPASCLPSFKVKDAVP